MQDHNVTKTNISLPPHSQINKHIHAWQFKNGEYSWRKPHNFSMTLYRKKDILNYTKNINYKSLKTLETYSNLQNFDLERVGLFYTKPKVGVLDEM